MDPTEKVLDDYVEGRADRDATIESLTHLGMTVEAAVEAVEETDEMMESDDWA